MSVFFRGTYEHTLDTKGRVAVPKKFREGLFGKDENAVEELIVTYGLSKQLFIYSLASFDDLSQRYSTLPGEDADLLDRFFGASARECALDGQGRIILSSQQLAFASLKKDVVWVGQRGHVELWSTERWLEAHEAVQQGIYTVSNERLKAAYSKIDFH